MAIVQHPLAAANLGAFVEHKILNVAVDTETANWVCFFCYEHGIVRQESKENSRVYQYDTLLDKPDNPVHIFNGKLEYLF